MEIKLIGDSKVAIVTGVISEEDCKMLHAFAVDAKTKNLPIANMELEDKMSDDEEEDTVTYWRSKNLFLRFFPREYRAIARELHIKQDQLFREYLDLTGLETKSYDSSFLEPTVIHVYKEGDNLDAHLDNNDYALVFYSSSPPDFTGGDLYYQDLGINITPARGMLVISPSKELHEVLTVTSGYRSAITTFITLD